MFDLAEILTRAGLRVTPQRLTLLELLLREGGHLTADDLYRRARPAVPGLSATSIYKTLDALQRAGLVREVHVGAGPLRYDAGLGAAHHHRVCRRCGRVEDVACGDPAGRACVTGHDLGDFLVEQIAVTYRGLCAACRVAGGAREDNEKGTRDD